MNPLQRQRLLEPPFYKFLLEIETILNKHDLIGLYFVVNKDEYEPEALAIIFKLCSAENKEDVGVIIYDVFVQFFGVEDIAEDKIDIIHGEMATDVWETWKKHLIPQCN